MNNILEMIRNEKVEWKKLWEVTSWDKKFNGVEKNKQQKVDKYHYYLASELQALSSNDGNIKILTTNITDMYANEDDVSNNISIGEIVCIPWGGNPVVQYFNGKFITGDNRIARSIDTNILLNKYLYYFLLENIYLIEKLYRGSGIKHPNMKRVLEIEIPIPSLETQERIVKILDTMVDHFTQLEAELEAELEARNKQYEYYRDKLLSEEYLNKSTKKFGGEINFFDIKSLCKRNRGMKITAKQMNDLDNPDGEVKIFAAGNTVAYVSVEDVGEDNIISEPSVIVKSRGNIDFDYYNKKFSHKNEMWSYSTLDKNVLNIKYLYYYLKNNLEYFKDKAVSGKLPQISIGITDNYKLPVPNIEVQKHIVSVLDNFNKIVTDINEGLPKEIELRQKQYEYYRERLLDFKRDDDE